MSQSSDPRPLRLWSALEFRDYRVLWVSSIAWMLTQQLRLLVTAVWLFEATGSAAQLGLIGAIQLVVQIPALLFGGALADRIDRKLLMAATQAVTFGVVAMLAVLASNGELDPWHVYLATAITSVTTVLGQPARSALTAVVVPRSYLMHAVATNNVTIQIGSIAAPLIFAGLAEGTGLTPVFYLVAGVAAASAVLPLGIRASGRPPGIRRSSLAREVWEGARFVARHPILPGLYALDFAITVVSFYRQIMPVIAAQLYGRGAGSVGVLTASNSLGAAAGGFLVLLLARYRAKGMIVLYATLFYGVLLFPFGLVEELWIGIVLIGLLGAAERDGRIVAVGASAEVAREVGPDATVVDLHGRALLPGFSDSHNHFSMTAFEPRSVDCRTPPMADRAAVLEAIAAAARGTPAGQWIWGLGYSAWIEDENGSLLRGELDEVAANNPVCVMEFSYHACFANSAALALVGIDRDRPDPPGGEIERDASGEPTGVLFERAMDLVHHASMRGYMDTFGPDAVAGLIEQNALRHLSHGITSVGDALVMPESAEAYRLADERGQLPIVIHQMRGGPQFFEVPSTPRPAPTLRTMSPTACGAASSRFSWTRSGPAPPSRHATQTAPQNESGRPTTTKKRWSTSSPTPPATGSRSRFTASATGRWNRG